MTITRAVVVGAGIAGVSAAAGMRAAGFDGEILLIGDEAELPYRRPPVSKEIIRGDKTPDQIRIKPATWYADNAVELVTGAHVTAIDPVAGKVVLADGSPIAFDQLLLATGGTARALPSSDGATVSGVRTLRTLADVPKLQGRLTAGQHLIVVGAGLIGSEIAASARGLGCEVTMLETAPLPLPRLLPPLLGQMYVDLHKSHGTELHTAVTVESIVDDGGETVVRAADGRTWSAPVVVVAVGMEPATGLAEAAGIEVAPPQVGGGIVVDASGQTSIPGIYAAGDVANMANGVLGGRHRVEHWQNAQNHGTAVGKAMAGADSTFVEVPWCWSDQYGINLQVTGWPEAGHDVRIRGSIDDHDFSAFFLDGDKILGAVTIGRPGDIRQARKWIAAGERVRPDVLADEDAALADSVIL
ncbi:MAG: FAD-dependent oxidoreductase [Actinomycetota bacterium]|nr:FAD-dependent oxidoreductase [Actinomycetota bacterium]